MINNKGQTLVLFVILIPFLFILISFIVDTGLLSLEKVKLENTVKDSIKDVLKNNKSSDELIILINKNIDKIKIKDISIENGIVRLSISKEYNGFIFNKKISIDLSYNGYMQNDKVIINKG